MVDRTALREVCQLLLDTVLEHAWDPQQLSVSQCRQQLGVAGQQQGQCDTGGDDDGCDERMLQFALQHLGSAGAADDGDMWQLDPRAVAREVAHIIFRKQESGSEKANVRMAVDDFLIEWTMSIPGTMTCPPLEYLQVSCSHCCCYFYCCFYHGTTLRLLTMILLL